jgi:hypothetical protein
VVIPLLVKYSWAMDRAATILMECGQAAAVSAAANQPLDRDSR